MPWMTRAVSSSGMVSDRPAMTEPATKITMLSWTRSFLSKRSASLPQIGVVAALASSAAVIDPGEVRLGALELGHDGGQRVGNDRAAQDGGEERREQSGEGLHDLAVGHRRRCCGGLGCAERLGGRSDGAVFNGWCTALWRQRG